MRQRITIVSHVHGIGTLRLPATIPRTVIHVIAIGCSGCPCHSHEIPWLGIAINLLWHCSELPTSIAGPSLVSHLHGNRTVVVFGVSVTGGLITAGDSWGGKKNRSCITMACRCNVVGCHGSRHRWQCHGLSRGCHGNVTGCRGNAWVVTATGGNATVTP